MRKWRQVRYISVICLFLVQVITVFGFDFDVCRFRGESGNIYVELYVELPRNSLTYERDSLAWYGTVNLMTRITRDHQIQFVDQWRITDYTDDPEEIGAGQRIIDVRIYNMSPGRYHFTVTAVDSVSGVRWVEDGAVDLVSFPPDRLNLSDIELSEALLPDGAVPKFDRDGFGLVPDIRRLFGLRGPFFLYYIEVYPPSEWDQEYSSVPQDVDSLQNAQYYTITRNILNNYGDTVMTMPSVSHLSVGKPFFDTDSVMFESLPNGRYTLVLNVSDDQGYNVQRSARFFTYLPDRGSLSNDSIQPNRTLPEISIEDSVAIEEEIAEIAFLLTRNQNIHIERMSLTEKRLFIREFWRRYDDDQDVGDVSLRDQFRERLDEADIRFGNSRSAGHKTNRGRIYVIYGEPDVRQTHPLEINTKPYEEWGYNNIEGGVDFVFVDRSGLGEYMLIHSTKRGEVNNPDWYERYVLRSGIESGR
ncbi:MAG: GWxTD domain-containing protein [Candidatus Electryoneaceae bacterium]|nr:GWxTD domain-containing protein [Candidatus Electryoneaceae bacterium]